VLEEACRVGENRVRIRIRTDRQKESAASALRGRIRRSSSGGLCLRDESRGKLGEAVTTTGYIQNRSRDKVSAHERYFRTKPNLRHLQVFGSIAYVHIPKEKWKKLDVKTRKVHPSRLFG
jgi:hypothetical protein